MELGIGEIIGIGTAMAAAYGWLFALQGEARKGRDDSAALRDALKAESAALREIMRTESEAMRLNMREAFTRLAAAEQKAAALDPVRDSVAEIRQELSLLDKDARNQGQRLAAMEAKIEGMRNDIRTLSHDVRTLLGIMSAPAARRLDLPES